MAEEANIMVEKKYIVVEKRFSLPLHSLQSCFGKDAPAARKSLRLSWPSYIQSDFYLVLDSRPYLVREGWRESSHIYVT